MFKRDAVVLIRRLLGDPAAQELIDNRMELEYDSELEGVLDSSLELGRPFRLMTYKINGVFKAEYVDFPSCFLLIEGSNHRAIFRNDEGVFEMRFRDVH